MDLFHEPSAETVLIALVVAAVLMGVLGTLAAAYSSAVSRYDLRVEAQRLRVEQASWLAACAEEADEDAERRGPRVRPFRPLPPIVSEEAPTATPAATRDSESALPTRTLLGVH